MKPIMPQAGTVEDFSLLGGPIHRAGRRLALALGTTDAVALALAFGLAPWAVLVILWLFEGALSQLFSHTAVGVHLRLLVVVPLFFACERRVDGRSRAFVRLIERSGVVPANALPALASEIARHRRWTDSWAPDALSFIAAALFAFVTPWIHLPGETAAREAGPTVAAWVVTGAWYWLVCLTLFRLLMFRWLLRLAQWGCFLWRLARLELHLVPTHPDGAGGLGYLEVVQGSFTLLVLSISIIQAASFAEDVSASEIAFKAIFPALAMTLLVDAALFLGPLGVFVAKLRDCKAKGLSDYGLLASRYVTSFEAKWINTDPTSGPDLLGTADLQSLADLSNSVNVVRNIRLIPAGKGLLVRLLTAAVLPMAPLLLLKYPAAELAEKFLRKLAGW
jgi:hypothetical protein